MATTADIWAQWLLHRRHGGDLQRLKSTLDYLSPVRDRVLNQTRLGEGCRLLDVGAGDGLIAFGALSKIPSCRVIFSDISQDLLDHAASLSKDMGVSERCDFLCAPATDLSAVTDSSVDAVTLRSVLIYVADKQRAVREFHRVLKPRGRLSLFEPINRFGEPQPAHMFWGYDATPIVEIAGKVKTLYQRLQPLESDPMMNFDERDLVTAVEEAGFRDVHLALEIDIRPIAEVRGAATMTWDSFIQTAPNPRIPSLGEAIAQVLTAEEATKFAEHMRPLVEAGTGTYRSAAAYLSATK